MRQIFWIARTKSVSDFGVNQEFVDEIQTAFLTWRILRIMFSSKSLLALPILCAGLTSFFAAGCGDRRDSFYPSLADAIKSGEVTRGWIPDFLPKGSRAIHIIYDPSSPRTWCAFEFSPDDSQRLRENLTSIDGLPPSIKRVPSPGVSWWPAVLKGNLDVVKINTAGFKLYKVEEAVTSVNPDILLFAVDWTNGRGFFYRTNE